MLGQDRRGQCCHPGDEQLHRALFQHIARLLPALGRHIERRNKVNIFSIDTQELPTGDEKGRAWTPAHDLLRELGGRVDDVFATVEHEQDSCFSNRLGNRRSGNLAPTQVHAESACDG